MAEHKEIEKRKVLYNIFFSCIAFLTNAIISLFITPYITNSVGAEAYGFVKLANDFASYGSLVTLALNSMSSRFIMLESERDNLNEARAYYSSITIANFLISLFLLIPSVLLILCVNQIFDVPQNMIMEVRLTFVWTFSNFLICLAGTTFGNCFFLKNKLYISSILTSITSILRAIFIIVAFIIAGPKISLMAFGSIVVTAVFMPCNIIFHKKLTPELYFDKKFFDLTKVFEVVTAGIWNSITRLSQILTTGLDLVVTNILLGALEMGYLSVAKTIPNYISGLINTIGNAFTPNMMQYYAKNDLNGLRRTIKTSMRIMTIFSTIPDAILIVLGTAFYSLWVPTQPAELLNILSILTVIGTCVLGPMQPLYQVFTLTNKIRESSLAFIVEGIVSIFLTMVCVKKFNMGVYAVAGVSVVLSIIVAFCYHLPKAAIYIDLPWYTFYFEIFKNMLILLAQCIIGLTIVHFFDVGNSWSSLFVGAMILGGLGLILSVVLILDKDERNDMLTKMKKLCSKIKKGQRE